LKKKKERNPFFFYPYLADFDTVPITHEKIGTIYNANSKKQFSRFPCLWQFGYEHRGCASAGLLALGSLASVFYATNLATDAYKFADTVTIYTHGNAELAAELQASLAISDIKVDNREIRRLLPGSSGSDIVVEFASGEQVTEGFMVHRPLAKQNTDLPCKLGLELGGMGEIKVNPPFHSTNIPGLYAAGDCASPFRIIPQAVAMGAYAGAGIGRELPKPVDTIPHQIPGRVLSVESS
jgi:gliotoxin/aspirochlorine biosynthesis thioredoxin reductase